MLVNEPRHFIRQAWENRYAVPAFNVCNLELAKAVLEAAEGELSPVILQTYPGDLEHAELKPLAKLLRSLAEQASVPVILHLDHASGLEMVVRCLREGYTSVMFDGSHLPLDENLSATRMIAKVAHALGATVEGELGSFGGEHQAMVIEYTHPDEAHRMFTEAEVDMLAVSAGSVHGEKSRLDLRLLEQVAARAPGPLVLHGGSGIHPEDLRQAVVLGVVKVNIGGAIFEAWLSGLKEGLELMADSKKYPKHYAVLRHAMDRVREEARRRFQLLGATGRAA